MNTKTIEISEEQIRKQVKTARRRARIQTFGQDQFKPKVEKSKVRYSRKQKHKKSFDNEF